MRAFKNADPLVKAALVTAVGGILVALIYVIFPYLSRQPAPAPTATSATPSAVSTSTPTIGNSSSPTVTTTTSPSTLLGELPHLMTR